MPVLIQLIAVIAAENEQLEAQIGRELAVAFAAPMKREEVSDRCAFHGTTTVMLVDDHHARQASALILKMLEMGIEQGAPTATMTEVARKNVDDIAEAVIRRRKERLDG